MKKIITYSFLALNLITNTGICYGGGWFSGWFETREQKLARTINPSPITVVEEREEQIKTKSQRPIKTVQNQNTIQTSILATAIKQNSAQKELMIKQGRDGRTRIENTHEWPNSVHGTVFMTFRSTPPNSYQWGSGTLIAPNLVLTAAHNLYDNEKREEVTKVEFYPAINSKHLPFGHPSKVIKYYFPKDYKKSNTNDFSLDYGLLVLDKPIGHQTGYFGLGVVTEALLKNITINITGYPSDKVADKDRCYEMWSMAGSIKKIENNIVHYEIDTAPGQSGSGVWYKEGEDYLVPGIHVGGDAYLGLNYAVLLTRARYNQITEWVKDSVSEQISRNILDGLFSTVTTINLPEKNIDDTGVKLFTSERFPHLTRLSLSNYYNPFRSVRKDEPKWNNVGDLGAIELAKLTNLTELDLRENNIGDKGAAELAKLTNLKRLNLMHNGIGDEGAAELAKLTNLNILDLEWNKISQEGKRALRSNSRIPYLRLG